jgi:type II secretory pathway component PulJ
MISNLNTSFPLNKKKTSIASGQTGFTLVDILMGLAVASVLMVAMVSLFTTVGRSYTTQNVAAEAQQVARAGVELMIQEIRMAGLDSSGSAAAAIVDDFDNDSGFHPDHDGKITPTDATQLAFTMDADMDGRIDHCTSDGTAECSVVDDNVENELIAYRLNNGALERYRAASASWEDLTEDNISNLNFTYYDETGTETTTLEAIRVVEISMTVQLPAGRGGTVSRTYATRVRCRNIGL